MHSDYLRVTLSNYYSCRERDTEREKTLSNLIYVFVRSNCQRGPSIIAVLDKSEISTEERFLRGDYRTRRHQTSSPIHLPISTHEHASSVFHEGRKELRATCCEVRFDFRDASPASKVPCSVESIPPSAKSDPSFRETRSCSRRFIAIFGRIKNRKQFFFFSEKISISINVSTVCYLNQAYTLLSASISNANASHNSPILLDITMRRTKHEPYGLSRIADYSGPG